MKYKFYIFTSENIKTYIFTPLSSEKYKIWIYFFLIYINVFITRDEKFYGIHWKRVNFLFILFLHANARFWRHI